MEEEGRGSSNKEKKKKLMVAIDERDCSHYNYISSFSSSSSSSSLCMFTDQNLIDFGYLQSSSLGSSSRALLRTAQEQNNNSASAHLEKVTDIWHQLPYDILSLIIQHLEFMDYHCGISLVCKNWRVACKKYCEFGSFPTPSDHIPWLMLRKSVTNPVLKFYRPLTNKTYKITSSALVCTNCLYSQDGWLLLHKVNLNLEPYCHSLFLFNIFTMDQIDLPKLGISSRIQLHCGTFSNHLKSPNYVVIIARNRCNTGEIYAWRKGDCTWNKKVMYGYNVSKIRNIWVCDDQLYYFSFNRSYTFDNDLNFKRCEYLSTNPRKTCNMTVWENNLFAFSSKDNKNSDVYMFDSAAMDWVKIIGTNLICFNSYFNHSIGVEIRVQSDREKLQNDLTSYGCIVTKLEELIITDKVVYGRRDGYLGDTWIHVG